MSLMDEPFDFDRYEQELDTPDTTNDVDVTKLSHTELLDKISTIDEQLKDLHELHFPRTVEGRELHSLRAALRIEVNTRF